MMNNKNTFIEIMSESRSAETTTISAKLPVKGGRSSVSEESSTIESFIDGMYSSKPDFSLKLLDALETLGTYHPDLSHAVSNIKELGHTDYKVTFDGDISDDMQSKMKKRIKMKSKDTNSWYSFTGGLGVLINDLLGQLALMGALSAEIIPEDDLSGVKKVTKVAPKNIRFSYSKELDTYEPYQKIDTIGTKYDGGLVKLNTVTYKYLAISRIGDKPYALPPFLAALENIAIGRDMQENFKYVVKKLGTLGFLEVLVNAPKPKPNEGDTAYYSRTKDYLDRVIPEIEKGLSKGYVAGFKDMHEFKMHTATTDAKGSSELNDMNDHKVMSGLKQDPLMFGRSFNTSETLGRVILAKMSRQIVNYQKEVASFLESLFLMDLQLAGFPIEYLTVEFDPPMIGDSVKREQATNIKLRNLDSLLRKGIISIETYATEAGYEEVADPEKHMQGGFPNQSDDDDDDDDGPSGTDPDKDPTDVQSSIKKLEFGLTKGLDEFPYISRDHPKEALEFSKEDPKTVNEFVSAYFDSTNRVYGAASRKASKQISEALAKLGKGATEVEIIDTVIYTLYNNWDNNFKKPQKKVVRNFVASAYKEFRSDKSIFGAAASEAPKFSFNAIDRRAIDYYKRSDSMYLGKFITDKSTKSKITAFIKEQHLTRKLPIGDNKEGINAFQKEFKKVLGMQDWKVRQIVDTTVNNMRNTAAINYMDQANVKNFEIIGVSDRLQCGYCAEMQGKKFSVQTSIEKIRQQTNSDPNYVSVDNPFLTAKYKSPEDLKGVEASTLQSQDIDRPPYHPYCRDHVIAVL